MLRTLYSALQCFASIAATSTTGIRRLVPDMLDICLVTCLHQYHLIRCYDMVGFAALPVIVRQPGLRGIWTYGLLCMLFRLLCSFGLPSCPLSSYHSVCWLLLLSSFQLCYRAYHRRASIELCFEQHCTVYCRRTTARRLLCFALLCYACCAS